MLVRRKDWREEADGQSWYVGVSLNGCVLVLYVF